MNPFDPIVMIQARLFLLSFVEQNASGVVVHEVINRPVDTPDDVDLTTWDAQNLLALASQFSAYHDPAMIRRLVVTEANHA